MLVRMLCGYTGKPVRRVSTSYFPTMRSSALCHPERSIVSSSTLVIPSEVSCGAGYEVEGPCVLQAISTDLNRNSLNRCRSLISPRVKSFDNSAPKHFWHIRFYAIRSNADLVETPNQWKWSSFRAYAFAKTGLVAVNDWTTVKLKLRAA